MIFIITCIFLLAAMLALAVNSDVFAPAKLFLLFFLMFHAGILFVETSALTKGLILCVLLAGSPLVVMEGLRSRNDETVRLIRSRRPNVVAQSGPDFSFAFWMMSIPSILAQLYMIREFGGLAGYFNSLGLRVMEWSGYGWARVLINLMMPINLVFFSVGLTRRRSVNWWLGYTAHFLIVLLIGALSGSRSSLLAIFAFQLISYHYLRGPVSSRLASVLAGGLVFSAMVLGVIRQGVRWDAGGLNLGEASGADRFSLATFYYGVDPLEMIATNVQMPLAGGSTFLSLFTNWIPRAWWPDKPDTGGVFFTKNYAANQWDGYSNLTPTFLGEWVINFGWAAGVIGFALSWSIIVAILNRLYRNYLADAISNPSQLAAVDVVIFIHVLWTAMALLPGETTNVAMNFALFQLVPLLGIRWALKQVLASQDAHRNGWPRAGFPARNPTAHPPPPSSVVGSLRTPRRP